MTRRIPKLIGNRYGRWVVLELAPSSNYNTKWKCRCNCGKEKSVYGFLLLSGRSVSCGCHRNDMLRLEYGQAAFNFVYNFYKNEAEDHDITWSIGKGDFRILTQKSCYYCSEPPSVETDPKLHYGTYTYNSLTRTDNDEGFTMNNTVTCCVTCRRAKRKLSQAQWTDWLERIRGTICQENQ